MASFIITIGQLPDRTIAENSESVALQRLQYLSSIEELLKLKVEAIYQELLPVLQPQKDDPDVANILDFLSLGSRAMKEWAKDVQIDHEITLGEEGEVKLYDGSHLDSSFQSTEKYRKTMFDTNKVNSKLEDGEEHLSILRSI